MEFSIANTEIRIIAFKTKLHYKNIKREGMIFFYFPVACHSFFSGRMQIFFLLNEFFKHICI